MLVKGATYDNQIPTAYTIHIWPQTLLPRLLLPLPTTTTMTMTTATTASAFRRPIWYSQIPITKVPSVH